MEQVLLNQTAKWSNGGMVLLVHGGIWAPDLFTNKFYDWMLLPIQTSVTVKKY